ncbi:hypothetical protein D3C72_2066570 [compost metagenome]
MDYRQHHFDLLALPGQTLDHCRSVADPQHQSLHRPTDPRRNRRIILSRLPNRRHPAQRLLHGLAFRLRLTRHLRQGLQAARHLVALTPGGSLGRRTA